MNYAKNILIFVIILLLHAGCALMPNKTIVSSLESVESQDFNSSDSLNQSTDIHEADISYKESIAKQSKPEKQVITNNHNFKGIVIKNTGKRTKSRKKISKIIDDANRKSRKQPFEEYYHKAVVKYAFERNALFSVYTAVGKITDIKFQKNEILIAVNAGDTANWLIEHVVADNTPHLYIKPVRSGLETNLTILTNRRTYLFYLKSWKQTFMAGLEFSYPHYALKINEILENQKIGNFKIDELNFKYSIKTTCANCIVPLSVFSNGEKIFLIMPEQIKHSALPALFAINDGDDNTVMINYRFVDGHKFIIDSLYPQLMLQYGGKGNEVYITASDYKSRSTVNNFLHNLFNGN